ncbi:4-(cytidine 5'-diphospho)-2-C-methyl-D-erythritol kinase [Candidatus Aerophobetes bacterium]|uniref:4-diphosphocytidyl-2-C-methyl-D-erythritol kinase n=1 Tax=Aerophobetes bacterium TaxID=2030807 RepID=A0A523UMA9_UNCAE|nr:MAG: 4-(cytidine 5'-diphospho)-2-C-methyl-D-erythritol kinase [Candidatus Aerophobetes bacterium]
MKELAFQAAAKINLYLDILGRRSDGYHEIESIVQSVRLYDKIILRLKGREIKIRCTHPEVPLDEQNTCYRAAEILLTVLGMRQGLEIEIQKNIPIGSGLGGGSADAAATLIGMRKLFQIDIPFSDLSKLALQSGSDVPFCLLGGTALVRGKGEKIIPLPLLKNGWFILVDPGISISTSWVYSRLQGKLTKKRLNIKLIKELIKKEGMRGVSKFPLYNKLEEVVIERFPTLRDIKAKLIEAGATGALMTGSGSTIFAVAEDEERVKSILGRLGRKVRVYAVQATDKSVKEA